MGDEHHHEFDDMGTSLDMLEIAVVANDAGVGGAKSGWKSERGKCWTRFEEGSVQRSCRVVQGCKLVKGRRGTESVIRA